MRITTYASHSSVRSAVSVSNPDIPFILRSSRIKSGCRSCARAIASAPLPASATTSNSSSKLNS
ncbi:Uncharacterised protein [Vibrio cholerae]|nr:Uncharacterised protein [Vibrio cholerae]